MLPGIGLDVLAAGSGLIVDRMIDKEGAYAFKFAEQPIPLHVVQIARQKSVNVQCEGRSRTIRASYGQDSPTLCLHCVKQLSLDILVNGFDYGQRFRLW